MFRHNGKGRTYSHNLKLASILSGVAGIVNITGLLELNLFTTNVTGHFAFFADELVLENYIMAFTYLFYILMFLFGAFFSSLIIEWISKYKPQKSYIIPISIEILLLFYVAFSGVWELKGYVISSAVLSSALLFSMGLQNALVTRVSQSVVRTTHLTGLFTDLGIELSQIFFYKNRTDRIKLNKSIFLKLAIICCFFTGGLIGGFIFSHLGLKTLLIPVVLLAFALWYDRLLFQFYYIKRQFRDHHF